MRNFFVFLAIVFLFTPNLSAQAQTSGTTSTPGSSCVIIYRVLYRGQTDYRTGGDITRLQRFLMTRPEAQFHTDTFGYFGPATYQAVVRFQRAYNVFPSGLVGLITRGKIKELSCNAPVTGEIKVQLKEQVVCITTPCNPVGISNARVSVSGNNQNITALTDSYGVARFGNLAFGTYTVTIEADRFQTVTRTVNVTGPENLLELVLIPNGASTRSVSLSANPLSGQAPLSVLFSAVLRNINSCRSISMSFGDGTSYSVMPSCLPDSPVLAEQTVTVNHTYNNAGTYAVALSANATQSNTITLTVGASQTPAIRVTAPNSSAIWPIGSNQTIGWDSTNMPTGAVIVFSLIEGPTIGRLTTIPSALASGATSVQIPDSIFAGDAGMMLAPGQYKVRAVLYDKMPCLGLCAPDNPSNTAVILAQDDSDSYITIASRPALPIASLGDLSGDGLVTVFDIELLLGHVNGTALLADVSRADVDGNGRLDKGDVIILRKVVLGIILQSELPVRFGDVNNDGFVTAADAVLATRLAQNLSTEVTAKGSILADVDLDGIVTLADPRLILGRAVELVTLPAMWGDASGDFVVSLADLVWVSRFVEGTHVPTAQQRFVSDVYNNGILNADDVNTMRQFTLGTVTSLPVIPPTQ